MILSVLFLTAGFSLGVLMSLPLGFAMNGRWPQLSELPWMTWGVLYAIMLALILIS